MIPLLDGSPDPLGSVVPTHASCSSNSYSNYEVGWSFWCDDSHFGRQGATTCRRAMREASDREGTRREKHAKRNRRLALDLLNNDGKIQRDGEERRLLAVAAPHLQRLIIAALETACEAVSSRT